MAQHRIFVNITLHIFSNEIGCIMPVLANQDVNLHFDLVNQQINMSYTLDLVSQICLPVLPLNTVSPQCLQETEQQHRQASHLMLEKQHKAKLSGLHKQNMQSDHHQHIYGAVWGSFQTPFQKNTLVRTAQSAVQMMGKLFQTNGKTTLTSGINRNNKFKASFSCASHSRALKDGMVNIHIDHILQRHSPSQVNIRTDRVSWAWQQLAQCPHNTMMQDARLDTCVVQCKWIA